MSGSTEPGGVLSAESEPGRGSTFRVSFPAATVPEVPMPDAPAAPAKGHRARVLFIDDEPMLCDLVTQVLKTRHEVAAVTSAREALALLGRGERYDVILCDLMMPLMTGMELHDELARVAPEQRERMVFLTGGAFTQSARDFLSQVPNARLEKPFDLDQLVGLVAARAPT